MTIDDRVMGREDRETYTTRRKLHPDPTVADAQRRDLRRVIIHNGYLTDQVVGILQQGGVPFVRYNPEESSEPHFWVPATGDLHVVNSRGVTRLIRDKDLARVLEEMLGHPVEVTLYHYTPDGRPSETDASHASKRFRDFAHELVQDIFQHIPDAELRQEDLSLLMGPFKSLDIEPKELVYELDANHRHRDYLQYKVLRIGGRLVAAFDYIFADQASNILQEVYAQLNANFPNVDVNVFHYGKVGILNPDWKVPQICLPLAAIGEDEICGANEVQKTPIFNELVRDSAIAARFAALIGEAPNVGTTVNTTSVLQQKRGQLERDLAAQGDMLEMEWSTMAGLHFGRSSRYPDLGRIRYFFAAVASDKPLTGETLASVPYARKQERKLVAAYKTLISEGAGRRMA